LKLCHSTSGLKNKVIILYNQKYNDIPQVWLEKRADLLSEIQKEKQWAYDPCNITKNAFRFLITTCYKQVIYLEDLERYIT
jgi:hypothetical protein